jgi:hypothetical protein
MRPKLLQEFSHTKKSVQLVSSSTPSLKHAPEMNTLIEKGWGAACAERPDLFDSRLLRVTDVENWEQAVRIRVAPDITYKDVVGFRHHRDEIQTLPPDRVFQSLTIILEVTTNDNDVVLLERDSGDWPHSLEFPGMFVRRESAQKTEQEILDELLAKDLGIDAKRCDAISLFSILDFKNICEMMLIYKVTLECATEELRAYASKPLFVLPPGYTSKRHDAFFSLPLHYPTAVVMEKLGENKT